MISHPKLYEINVAAWLYELSRKYDHGITLHNVPAEEWDILKDCGFHYIWLMGIWKRSKTGMKIFQGEHEYVAFRSHLDAILPGWTDDDVPGSPYSIAAYEPEPLFGDWAAVDTIREHLHRREMNLILDFVPNHTAPDHPWMSDHTDFYIQGSEDDYRKNPTAFSRIMSGDRTVYMARGKNPYSPPWSDTVQLNYFNPHMRTALTEELKKIAAHCDGVRCDMAMLVLNEVFAKNWSWAKQGPTGDLGGEFWEELRNNVPGLLLIAEAYWNTERYLMDLGFDYVYDKELYDLMRIISPVEITRYLKADYSYQHRLVRFIENHDEPRSAEVFGREEITAAVVLFSTVPGMKMYHQGQLEGKKIRIPVQIRRVRREEPDTYISALHQNILAITRHDAFVNGRWELKEALPAFDGSHDALVAYTWQLKDALKLVVVNMSRTPAQGRIPLKYQIEPDRDYNFRDELDGRNYIRNGQEIVTGGLHVILKGFHSHIFEISPVTEE